MQQIAAILNIDLKALQEFPLQANLVNDVQNKRVIDSAITNLRRIETNQSARPVEVSVQTLDVIKKKVYRLLNGKDNNTNESLSTRELRILSYNLSEVEDNKDCFNFIVSTIEKNWRNLFFNGLIHSVMSYWNEFEPVNRIRICELIRQKLSVYTDNCRRYLDLKNHSNIFDEAGPSRLSALLKRKQISLIEAPTAIGFRESTFIYSFYDNVIVNSLSNANNVDLRQVEEVLRKHNNDKTNKLVLANLIIDANVKGDITKQSQISNLARRILGDIDIPQTWAPFYKATSEEIDRLRIAYETVKTWNTRRVIETFFDICVQDPNRKKFWMEYVPYIDSFKIAGSTAVRSSLRVDYRVGELLDSIFIGTNSDSSSTAALVLFIRNKVIIEFSNVGCVYVYPQNHKTISNIKSKKYIKSISDLKDKSIGALDYWISEYGYMRHAGDWQWRLSRWMSYKIENQEETPSSYNPVFTTVNLQKPKKRVIKEDATVAQASPNNQELSLFGQKSSKSDEPETTFYTCSKAIFNNAYKIQIGNKGVYITKIRTNSSKLLYSIQNIYQTRSGIWIKQNDVYGYLPIVLHTEENEIDLGRIKMIGLDICYKSPAGNSVVIKTNQL